MCRGKVAVLKVIYRKEKEAPSSSDPRPFLLVTQAPALTRG